MARETAELGKAGFVAGPGLTTAQLVPRPTAPLAIHAPGDGHTAPHSAPAPPWGGCENRKPLGLPDPCVPSTKNSAGHTVGLRHASVQWTVSSVGKRAEALARVHGNETRVTARQRAQASPWPCFSRGPRGQREPRPGGCGLWHPGKGWPSISIQAVWVPLKACPPRGACAGGPDGV